MGFKPLYRRNQQMSLHYYMHFCSILIVAKRALSIVRLSDIAGIFLMMMISLTIYSIYRLYSLNVVITLVLLVKSLLRYVHCHVTTYYNATITPLRLNCPLLFPTIQIRPKFVKHYTVTGTLSRRMMNYRIYSPSNQ